MKNSHTIFIIILFLTACVSTNQVFFSDPNYLKSDEFSSSETIKEAYSENIVNDQDTLIESDEESYFDEENYYDFSYSSRIRRLVATLFFILATSLHVNNSARSIFCFSPSENDS